MTGTMFSARALAAQLVRMLYPVGVYLDFDREIDPNTAIGCGTVWQRVADGRTLIASDTAHPVGWTGGEVSHQNTLAEMPEHQHMQAARAVEPSSTGGDYAGYMWKTDSAGDWGRIATDTVGNSQPHNNMQPSLAVCRWVRVA